jgi:DNA invertase Pin-like site-specific DNA recombinase
VGARPNGLGTRPCSPLFAIGHADVIVAEDSSRLWRSLAEQAPRVAELHDLGVHVVTHDLDTRHESSEWVGPILGTAAQAYRKEIARRNTPVR